MNNKNAKKKFDCGAIFAIAFCFFLGTASLLYVVQKFQDVKRDGAGVIVVPLILAIAFYFLDFVLIMFCVKPTKIKKQRYMITKPLYVGDNKKECPACMAHIPYPARKCMYCEAVFCDDGMIEYSEANRLTFIFLGIFLGGIGINNIYIGEIGRCILKCIILLGGIIISATCNNAIWFYVACLCNTIFVLCEICDTKTDSKGRLLR